MKVKIYCLIDPITCKVRYIGRTTKKYLEHRLIEHLSKAKYFERYLPGKAFPHRVNWIKSLLNQGLEPKIRLLCEVEGWTESHQKERFLINKYKNSRNLTNSEDRGEGGINKIISQEQRIQISKTLKEFNKKDNNMDRYYSEVFVYDKDGKFVKKFKSNIEAAKELKVSVGHIKSMRSKLRHPINGYYFKNSFLENIPLKEKVPNIKLICKKTNQELIFDNTRELQKYFTLGKDSGIKAMLERKAFKKLLLDYDLYLKNVLFKLPFNEEIC